MFSPPLDRLLGVYSPTTKSALPYLEENALMFLANTIISPGDNESELPLIKSKSICIAYETVTDDQGRLPLLAPMSAVAGRMSIQAGAHSLEKNQKGRGLLLGGAPGVEPANVVILGGGVVGENAALIATGM